MNVARKKFPKSIRCNCGFRTKAMFTDKSPQSLWDLYHCDGCGDLTEGTSGKVIGGGATKKEIEDSILTGI